MEMQGWHFLSEDQRLRFGKRRLVEVGKTYRAVGALSLCNNGMHASKRIIDALNYAPGPICCRVLISGQIIEAADKVVARSRRVLGMLDATKILHEFACLCAEDALKLDPTPDPRSVAAIKAKRDWLAGKISEEDLAAAWSAAWDAARDAARAAAWSAAWDAARAAAWDAARAAARDAAWAAARDAARAAARDAAWAAARDAAWDAARAAARDAAWAAARDAQNDRLTLMVEEAMG